MADVRIDHIFEDIVETIPHPLLMLDSGLRILKINHGFCKTFKIAPEETIGNFIYDLGNRQWDIPKLRTLLEDVISKDQKVDNFEVEHIFPKIGRKIMMLNARCLKQNGISSQMILLYIEDITARKRAEAALQESESKYQDLYDNAPDMFVSVDSKTGAIISCNQTLADALDYKKEEIIGRAIFDVYAPDSAKHAKEVLFPLFLKTGSIQGEELQIQRKDGSKIDVSLNTSAVHDDQGNIIYSRSIWREITARKLSDKALKESEEKFRHVFETANVGKSITLPTGKISVNNAFADMLGYSREELSNKTWQELTPPDEIESTQVIIALLQNGEKDSVRFNKRYIHKDGSFVWADVSAVMQRDKDGKPLYFITTIVDITERVQAEEKLRLSEERFFTAFQVNPAGMTITRIADGKFLDVNEAFLRMFEFSREEVIGHTSTDLEMLSFQEREKLIQTQLESGGLSNTELKARSKSGKIINILFSSKPIELVGETYHLTTMVDITERKKAEEALRESEQRFKRAFENIPDVVVIYDTDLRIRYINKATIRITGRPESDFIGRREEEIWPSEVYNRYMPTLLKSLNTGTIQSIETEIPIPDGKVSYLNITCVPLFDNKGNVREILGITHDLTERKKSEANRLELEAVLRQTQKMESIGTLAGGVAHEINNPINGIMNYAQLIVDRIGDNPIGEFAREIIHETERIARIVRNLLTFAREGQESHSPARLKDIVNDTISLIQTILRRDQITLAVDVSEDLPKVKCRSQQIQQVIMNLVTNARDALNEKYSKYDENKLMKISSNLFEKDGKEWIRLTVGDYGSGIDPAIVERIFDPFFTSKPKKIGTGLGLSISYGIVKDHHGELTFESEPGRYTRFHMDLPVDKGWNLEKDAEY